MRRESPWHKGLRFSITKNHTRVVKDVDLYSIYGTIKMLGPLSRKIKKIRQLYRDGFEEEGDRLKKSLQGFTPSGVFTDERNKENLTKYTELVLLDIDNIPVDRVAEIKTLAIQLPYTLMCFISPSGLGLKILVGVNSTVDFHKEAYQQVAKYYTRELNIPIDMQASDLARQHYLSHDSEAYLSEVKKVVFNIKMMSVNDASTIEDNEVDYQYMFNNAVKFTENIIDFEKGSRNRFIHQLACNCNRIGIPKHIAIQNCLDNYCERGFDKREIWSIAESVYKSNAVEFGRNLVLSKTSDAEKEEIISKSYETPILPAVVTDNLPTAIKFIADKYSDPRERDVFITSMLIFLSGSINTLTGIYKRREYHPNLFGFIVAPPASGKGALNDARDLFQGIHRKILNESKQQLSDYKKKLQSFKNSKKNKNNEQEEPEPPPFKMLFVPANSTTSVIYQHLDDCDGTGILVETEADTLAKMLKHEIGDTSSLLRCSFQGEPLTFSRMGNRKYIEIARPQLSVLLSGTPKQVPGIVNSPENGLFSRFIFYTYHRMAKWEDVSPINSKGKFPQDLKLLANEISIMVESLNKTDIKVKLTTKQWDNLNTYFDKKLKEISCFYTEEASSVVFRYGLMSFKIMMILTAVRKYEEELKDCELQCNDLDFEVAIHLIETYIVHSMAMFQSLPSSPKLVVDNKKMQAFYDLLMYDVEFSRKEAIGMAEEEGLNISEKTVWNYLNRLIKNGYLEKSKHGKYLKESEK